MVAGGTLVWKRIQLVNDAVLIMVMIFSASALPLFAVPGWWYDVSRFFPLTDVIGNLYRPLFTDQPAVGVWGMGRPVPMLAVSLCYLAAGIVTFTIGERTAKRRGALGRY